MKENTVCVFIMWALFRKKYKEDPLVLEVMKLAVNSQSVWLQLTGSQGTHDYNIRDDDLGRYSLHLGQATPGWWPSPCSSDLEVHINERSVNVKAQQKVSFYVRIVLD